MVAEVTKPDFSYVWSSGGANVLPSAVKIQTGWTAEVPPFQWENAIQNRQDNAIVHLFQKGISEWDAASNYYFTASGVRSYVQGSDGIIYVAVQDSVGQNPTTDVSDTYWKVAFASTAQATETVQGVVELATTAEAQTGTDDVRVMTALKVKQAIKQFAAGDLLNAAIATVAAAGTIDLTAGALNTSQLVISGTGVTINGFTVAANRFFVVKMTGASNTLANSASLVTGRGTNIPVVAGDAFLMRSTAANTVEIVGGTFLVDRAIGSGQTVQQFVSPNRLPATDYTNLTGQTIWVCVNTSLSGAASLQMRVDGLQVDFNSNPEPGVSGSFSVSWPVPNGSIYRIERTGTANTLFWFELRKP